VEVKWLAMSLPAEGFPEKAEYQKWRKSNQDIIDQMRESEK
jgi:hypothetical protein